MLRTVTLPKSVHPSLTRIFHDSVSRDRETGNPLVEDTACGAGLSGSAASANKMSVPRAAQALSPRVGHPQGLESEANLNSTSQGELVLPVPGLSRGACRRNTRGRPASGSASSSYGFQAGGQSLQLGKKDGPIHGRSSRIMKHAG